MMAAKACCRPVALRVPLVPYALSSVAELRWTWPCGDSPSTGRTVAFLRMMSMFAQTFFQSSLSLSPPCYLLAMYYTKCDITTGDRFYG